MSQRKPFNPFYFLLAAVGVAFCVTASAFGLMTLRQARAPQAILFEEAESGPHPLMTLMDRHGMPLMLGEIAVLAVLTFAAIGTDQWHINRQARAEALVNGLAPRDSSEAERAESNSTQKMVEQGSITP